MLKNIEQNAKGFERTSSQDVSLRVNSITAKNVKVKKAVREIRWGLKGVEKAQRGFFPQILVTSFQTFSKGLKKMCRAQTAHQQDSFWDPENVLSFYFKQKSYSYLKALQSISIAAEKKKVYIKST